MRLAPIKLEELRHIYSKMQIKIPLIESQVFQSIKKETLENILRKILN